MYEKFPKSRFPKILTEISKPKVSTISILKIEFFSFLGLRSQILLKRKVSEPLFLVKRIDQFEILEPSTKVRSAE